MRLRQILINLLGNAIKFTNAGEVTLATRLVQDRAGPPRVEFDVVDTGVGMTPAQVQKLFVPFSQADASTSRKFGGTGLGLAISQRLARALGGEIQVVDTRPGRGTRFRLSVPAGALDGVPLLSQPFYAAHEPAGGPAAGATANAALRCRVLLAEDGIDNQRLFSHLLTRAGARVEVVENGRLAVAAALAALQRGEPFDVILMDMQMPEVDGYEATRQLRRSGYTAPVIALTAHAMAGDQQKCRAAGCDEYVTKPIHRERLLAAIRAHLAPAAVK